MFGRTKQDAVIMHVRKPAPKELARLLRDDTRGFQNTLYCANLYLASFGNAYFEIRPGFQVCFPGNREPLNMRRMSKRELSRGEINVSFEADLIYPRAAEDFREEDTGKVALLYLEAFALDSEDETRGGVKERIRAVMLREEFRRGFLGYKRGERLKLYGLGFEMEGSEIETIQTPITEWQHLWPRLD